MAEDKTPKYPPKPKNPCTVGCTKRHARCHAKCIHYLFYRIRLQRYKQGLSDYWHNSGYDPAIRDRNRQLRAALRKRK